MYIVHYILGNTNHWKMFNDYQQAWDFAEMCDNCTKVIKFCPTSSKPQVIKWKNTPVMKTECDYGMTLDQAGVKEPLVMPAVSSNEYELILEEALIKMYNLVKGLAEQLKRLGGNIK